MQYNNNNIVRENVLSFLLMSAYKRRLIICDVSGIYYNYFIALLCISSCVQIISIVNMIQAYCMCIIVLFCLLHL